MSKTNFKTTINAPKEKVWAILADFGGVHKWAPAVTHSATLNNTNRGVGCERTCQISEVGSIKERIIEWNEGKGYKYEVSAIPHTPVKSAISTWTITPEGSKTIVELSTEFSLDGSESEKQEFLKQSQILFSSSLEGLKQFVESGLEKTISAN